MDETKELARVREEIEYDGMVLPSRAVSKENVIAVKDSLTITERDVLVTSYPRSGSTWLGEATHLVLNDGKLRSVEEPRYKRIMFVEHFLMTKEGVSETETYLPVLKQMQQKKIPSMIKTHLPVRYFKEKIEAFSAKVICIMRNPKDVLVSLYNFYHDLALIDFKGEFKDFFALWRAKRLIYGDPLEFCIGYWKLRHLPNVLIITYEDAKEDPIKTVTKIATFLDKRLSQTSLEAICNHLNFENMQQNKATNAEDLSHIKEGKHIRKGKVGAWKNVLTVAQSEEIVTTYGEIIRKYELPIAL